MRHTSKIIIALAGAVVLGATWLALKPPADPKKDQPLAGNDQPGVSTVVDRSLPPAGGDTASPAPLTPERPVSGLAGDTDRSFRPQPTATPEPPSLPAGSSLQTPPSSPEAAAPVHNLVSTPEDPAGPAPGVVAVTPADPPARAPEPARPATPPVGTITAAPGAGTTAPPTPVPAATAAATYEVRSGDTGWSIASAKLGTKNQRVVTQYLDQVRKANPKVNLNTLRVKQKITLPAPAAELLEGSNATNGRSGTAAAPVRADRAYTIKPGEGWEVLAERFLGARKNWPELYEHNRERVGNDWRKLRAGMIIELPEGAKLPAPTPAGTTATKPASR